ncbi:hypothetical protein C3L33_01550, partial [Rhododendron williamsianum]
IDVSSSIVNGSDNSANCEVSSGTIEGEKMISSLIVEGDKDEGVESEYSSLSCVSFCDSVDATRRVLEALFIPNLIKAFEEARVWGYRECVLGGVEKVGLLVCDEGDGQSNVRREEELMRAQTERDILGLLDHPFLPTLYSHFETEKFSCLLMEFCSGGDLHILRQRQPGKHFSEQAARLVRI